MIQYNPLQNKSKCLQKIMHCILQNFTKNVRSFQKHAMHLQNRN